MQNIPSSIHFSSSIISLIICLLSAFFILFVYYLPQVSLLIFNLGISYFANATYTCVYMFLIVAQ